MAVYNILRLNKMTCGTRRGLVDMYVSVNDVLPNVILLPGTHLSGDMDPLTSNAGIITESNTTYSYRLSNIINDY